MMRLQAVAAKVSNDVHSSAAVSSAKASRSAVSAFVNDAGNMNNAHSYAGAEHSADSNNALENILELSFLRGSSPLHILRICPVCLPASCTALLSRLWRRRMPSTCKSRLNKNQASP